MVVRLGWFLVFVLGIWSGLGVRMLQFLWVSDRWLLVVVDLLF